jgi:hypothetical protein
MIRELFSEHSTPIAVPGGSRGYDVCGSLSSCCLNRGRLSIPNGIREHLMLERAQVERHGAQEYG